MSNLLLLRRRLLLDNNKIDLGYVANGLIFQIDGIFNTKNGNDKTSTIWEDLIGDNFVPLNTNDTWGVNCLLSSANKTTNELITGLTNNCTVEIVYKYEGDYHHLCQIGNITFKGRSEGNRPWWSYDNNRASYKKSLNYNEFYNVAFSLSDNKAAAYLNGVEDVSNSLDAPFSITAGKLSIGASRETMVGRIYAIRIYNRALTSTEVLHNYNLDIARFAELDYVQNGLVCFYDAEFNSLDGHKADTTTIQNLINPGTYDLTCNGGLENLYDSDKKGFVFPGTASANITVPRFASLDNVEECTYEVVLRATNTTNVQRILYLPSNKEFFYRNGLNYGVFFDGRAGSYNYSEAPTNVLSTMAGTFKAQESKKFYLNGVLLGTQEANAASQTAQPGSIGSGKGIYPLANGSVFYNFRVYNRQLSDNELLQNHNLDKQRFGE